jgi:hypothetical protein
MFIPYDFLHLINLQFPFSSTIKRLTFILFCCFVGTRLIIDLSFLLVTVLISISNVSPSVFNAITSQHPKPEILSQIKFITLLHLLGVFEKKFFFI